jgi:hypothetical protein
MSIVQSGTSTWISLDDTCRVEFPTTGSDITDHEYAVRCIQEMRERREGHALSSLSLVRFCSSYQGIVHFTEVEPAPVISEVVS